VQPGKGKPLSRAMRNRGVEIYMARENAWFLDPVDCRSVLRGRYDISDDMFQQLWASFEVLRGEGI